VDPDDVLRGLRRLSLRSSLTVSLATRLVPVLGRDAVRLATAYELRAIDSVAHHRRGARVRRAATLTRALAGGALERAVDVAAALEVRGFGAASRLRAPSRRAPWSRHDVEFAASAGALVAAAIGGLALGLGAYSPYPTASAPTGPADCALAAAVLAAIVAPFRLARRSRA
jgi:energy-coupling factor transport system permease protein